MKEIELTFLAKYLPEDLESAPHEKIVDVYIPPEDPDRYLRLRQKGDRFEICKKVPQDNDYSQHEEHAIELNKEEFIALQKSPGLVVEKIRYYYAHHEVTFEIDVFAGALQGLVLIEVEFLSEEEKDAFVMPDFCLVDVTQEPFVRGGLLAGKAIADIQEQLEKHKYALV